MPLEFVKEHAGEMAITEKVTGLLTGVTWPSKINANPRSEEDLPWPSYSDHPFRYSTWM